MNERQKLIYLNIKNRKIIKNSDLIKELFLSEATLRRDLTELEKQGFIERTHGGAKLIESKVDESSVAIRLQTRIKEKRKIANECSRFISNGKTYFMDSSSTVGQIISLYYNTKDVTVITYGLYNALLLSQANISKIYIPSGVVANKTNSSVGAEAINFIENFFCDYVFISCSGISLLEGITEVNYEQSLIKRQMIKSSKKHVLLVDSSKFNKLYMCRTCSFTDIDIVITDRQPPIEYIEKFKEYNIELIVSV